MKTEIELVLALCRSPLSDRSRLRASEIMASRFDWRNVFEYARAFEVEPAVHGNLRALADVRIPEDVRVESALRERDSTALAVAGCLRVADMSRRFEERGIPIIVLKGAAVGAMAYDDPSLRTSGDVDLLVPLASIDRAREFLLELGYARNYESASEKDLIAGRHALEFIRNESLIELHVGLVERYLRFELEERAIWDKAVSISIPGGQIRGLDPARLFLFLCAHGTKHEWSRVRWIIDLAQLADRLTSDEASEIVRLAQHANAQRILVLGLALVRNLFGDSVGATLAEQMNQDPIAESMARQSLGGLGLDGTSSELSRVERAIHGEAGSLLFWVRSRERWLDRAGCIGTVLFSPTSADKSFGPFGRVTRPVRLAARFTRQVGTRLFESTRT